jgi:hypothetical protein
VRLSRWFSAPALAATFLLVGGGGVLTAETQPPKEIVSFGTLRATPPDAARSQADAWLKGVGKTDDATQQAFAALWQSDRSVLDKVTETLVLGDAQARALLTEARNPSSPAPLEVPAVLKDTKKPAFYRANLALAYGKALSNRRVYEEALAVLSTAKVEQVVDPATYLFHKAVAEHATLKAREANGTIVRLLDDVPDAPERYKTVAALMVFDILTWKDRDLGAVARLMDNIERRLDLARGGPKTQRLQKEAIVRLEELIKEKENQAGGS